MCNGRGGSGERGPGGGRQRCNPGSGLPAMGPIPLPDAVIDALDIALADERLALSTYKAILARFGNIRPFVNIAQAEQRHINALRRLYARYGVRVPDDRAEVVDIAGTAQIPDLCQRGVDAETENVRLYDAQLLPAVAGYPDILSVLAALRDASANHHLPAFRRCAGRGGRVGFGKQGDRK